MISELSSLMRRAYGGLPREVWWLCGALFVHRAGTMVLPFLQLFMIHERGLTVADAGLYVSVYGAGGIVGALLGGWLADRLGPIRAQRLLLAGSGALLPPLIFLPTGGPLVVGLFVFSVISESYRPTALAAVAEIAPPELHARCFALLRLALNLGMAAGPALGGRLARIDYDWLFWVDAATCLAAAGVLWSVLKVRPPARIEPGAQGGHPWRDLPYLALLAWIGLMAAVLFQVFSTYPVHLERAFGLAEDGIGLVLGFNALLIAIFEMPLVARLERRNPFLLVGAGAALMCVGLGLLPLGSSVGFLLGTVAIWTLGEMLALPMLNVIVVARAGAGRRGAYLGAYTLAYSGAFSIAPALGSFVYARIPPDTFWWGIGALALPLLLGALALRPLLDAERP